MREPGTIVQETDCTGTSARSRVYSRSSPSTPLRTVTATLVPASPRIQPMTSPISCPVVSLPSTLTTMSPALSPAFSAGLSLNTVMISGRPSSAASTLTPIPTYVPERPAAFAARSAGVMNDVWPVSPTASVIPLIDPQASAWSSSSARATYCLWRVSHASRMRANCLVRAEWGSGSWRGFPPCRPRSRRRTSPRVPSRGPPACATSDAHDRPPMSPAPGRDRARPGSQPVGRVRRSVRSGFDRARVGAT